MIQRQSYTRSDGSRFEVEYDTEAPCLRCGLPVFAASMSGTAICPWCDMGKCRYDAAHRVDGPEDAREHYARHHPPHA